MNELWRQQVEPLVRELRKAFDGDLETWWESGRRQYSSQSLRAKEVLAESQYVTHGQPSPVYDAYATGELSLRFAQEYLWATIDSILSSSLFPPFALARCSLEATARGYWLLAPEIGIEERVRRGGQYYAQCLAEVRKMLDAAPQGSLTARVTRLKADEEEILEWARVHKLTEKTGTAAFARSCRGFTNLVDELVGDIPGAGNIAPMVYRWLSGSAHANPMVFLEFGRRVSPPGDEQNVLQMRASRGTAWFPIWLAARGLQTALVRLADVSGWESPDGFLNSTVAKLGQVVDASIEHTAERISKPIVYQEYLDGPHTQ